MTPSNCTFFKYSFPFAVKTGPDDIFVLFIIVTEFFVVLNADVKLIFPLYSISNKEVLWKEIPKLS